MMRAILRSPGSRALLAIVLLATWVTSAHAVNPAAAAPATSGQGVYDRWCAPCHAPGPGHPGTQSLQVKYAGKVPSVLLERTDLSAAAVAAFVRHGVLSMPPFRKTEITDAELSALAAYVAGHFKNTP